MLITDVGRDILCEIMRKKKIDKPFLYLTIALAVVGFLLFFSVALGTLSSTQTFMLTIAKQLIALIIGFGILYLLIKSSYDYKKLKYLSLWFFAATVLFELMVFIPGLGVTVNGANRWVDIGITTIQPSEFLKIGVIIFLAALLSEYKKKLSDIRHLVLVMVMTIGICFVLLFLTRDIGTFAVLAISVFFMLLASHARNTHILGLAGAGIASLLALLFFFRRYAWERLMSFGGLTQDALGADFQVNQSLYTIGSGEIWGRGFGRSIQKFGYLPEPLNDSVFAVTAEEWGFIGSCIIITLFLALILRGLHIATRIKEPFGYFIVLGLISAIGVQSFINIAAMLKLFPLSGMPLLFVSQGGSAILFVTISCGLILLISKDMKRPTRKKSVKQ